MDTMAGSEFRRMAKQREEESKLISDSDVYASMVENIVKLDVDYEMKVDILHQSITDVGTIFGLLKMQNDKGNLSNLDLYNILEIFIAKLERERKSIDYNPLKYST